MRLDSDGEDESASSTDEEYQVYVPRFKMYYHKVATDDKVLREKQGNPLRFTDGTDPRVKKLIEFLVDDSNATPRFLPMNPSDSNISANVIHAASINSMIPISEYVRKEFYYNCFTKFIDALGVNPALVKYEISQKLNKFDQLYAIEKSEEQKQRDNKFT